MDGEDQLKAVLLEQNQFFEQENSDLRRQLHRCQADAAAAATAAAAQAAAAAAQAAAAAAADQSRLEKQHQLEDKVAELEKALRRRERGQGSSAGSTKDEEVPALHIAAQLAAADPAAAEAPQPAEAGAGEGQGADAAVDDLSIPLSSLGLGKLGWAGQAGCLWLSCACSHEHQDVTFR